MREREKERKKGKKKKRGRGGGGVGARKKISNKRENRWINPSMGMNLLHSYLTEEVQNTHSCGEKLIKFPPSKKKALAESEGRPTASKGTLVIVTSSYVCKKALRPYLFL